MKLPDRLMRIGEFFYIQISNPSAALVPFRKGDIGEERRFSYLFKCAHVSPALFLFAQTPALGYSSLFKGSAQRAKGFLEQSPKTSVLFI